MGSLWFKFLWDLWEVMRRFMWLYLIWSFFISFRIFCFIWVFLDFSKLFVLFKIRIKGDCYFCKYWMSWLEGDMWSVFLVFLNILSRFEIKLFLVFNLWRDVKYIGIFFFCNLCVMWMVIEVFLNFGGF